MLVTVGQHTIEAVVENIEKAPGRCPVKIGAEGNEVYVYRDDVANRAIQRAGIELGMFTERMEISHPKSGLDNLSDLELVQTLQREATPLLEYHSRRDDEDQS